MSMLNQSISPHGQPTVPPKGANSRDASQHLSMAYSRQRKHSLKKTPLFTVSGYSTQGESFSEKIELESKTHKESNLLRPVNHSVSKLVRLLKDEGNLSLMTHPFNQIKREGSNNTLSGDPEFSSSNTLSGDPEFRPFALSFLDSLMENEKLNLIKDAMAEIDIFSATQNNTLVVAVSSAVKLERKQLEQIARKMERVTGSGNLKLENTVDPSLIAGFIISYKKGGSSQVIDLSVRRQLAELVARIESTDRRTASHGDVGVL